jgi:hypothetical protein
MRDLVKLEELGYITKKKVGRKNTYTLREKIAIPEAEGRPPAVATWDYLPGSVQHAVADLKNVIVSGKWDDAKIVHIDTLHVNITEVRDGGVNIQNFGLEGFLASLPENLRRQVEEQQNNPQKKSGK